MKKLWLIVIPLLVLSLAAGAIGCGNKGRSTPTATPTQTAAVTATPTPTATSTGISTTHLTPVTRGLPTPTPSSVRRITLPSATDTITLSSLVRTTAAGQNLSGYALVDALRAVPRVSAIDLAEGQDDSDFFSALEFSLTEDELSQYNLGALSDITHGSILERSFPAGAPTPHYYIKVQVILCANSDGSGGAASYYAVTAEYMKQVIDVANGIFDDAGIWLVYDPATDFTTVNDTMVNMDFTVPSDINYSAPSDTPPLSESEIKTLAQPHTDARQSLAREYRGKMVLLLCDGNELVYDSNIDPTLSRWKIVGRGYAFSCEACEFVAMPTGQGDVQDWARLLAHEGGHYYHQQHTFAEVQLTGAENADKSLSDANKAEILSDRAASWITDYINQGHSASDGLDVFDGDLAWVSDTPPDPGPQFFYYLTGDACDHAGTVDVTAHVGSSYKTYTLAPDRGDVVSYFFRCWNISQHYSPQQITDMRKSMEQENRWHLIHAPMRLKTMDTHVLNGQVYYSAVWQPSTSNDVAVFGWAKDDFVTKANDMLNSGWSMTQLNSYVLNGEVYYDAVWQPGTSNDYAVLGWTFTDFSNKCSEQYDAGMRLKLIDTYVIDNQVYYNAVWQPGTSNAPAVFGWASADFVTKANDMLSSGWKMKVLNSYVLNGQVYYDAVWQSGTSDEYAVLGWSYNDFLTESNNRWNSGWRTTLLDTYELNGEVYYNAVWQPSTSDDYAVYGWASTDFLTKYDNVW